MKINLKKTKWIVLYITFNIYPKNHSQVVIVGVLLNPDY